MKVFDLGCQLDHRFEGWFASQAAFDDQQARGLVECPICGSHEVRRLLSAPRLNLSGAQAPASASHATADARGTPATPDADRAAGPPVPVASGVDVRHLQAMWLKAVRHVVANTEDVGARFAEEARRIHYGESDARAIRGVASRDEARALVDEGIDVMSLPVPQGLDGPLQ